MVVDLTAREQLTIELINLTDAMAEEALTPLSAEMLDKLGQMATRITELVSTQG